MTPQDTRRKAELAKIHIAKKELGLDDDLYHEIITTIGKVKSGSAADLDSSGRARVINHFKQCGFSVKENSSAVSEYSKGKSGSESGSGRGIFNRMKYTDLDDRDPEMATGKQMRYIEAMWGEVSYCTSEEKRKNALRSFVKKMTKTKDTPGVDDVRFLTSHQAHVIITAIKRMADAASRR